MLDVYATSGPASGYADFTPDRNGVLGPPVTIRILFTDLVGFTEFNEAVGDARAVGVLDQQRRVVDAQLGDRVDERLFDRGPTFDSFSTDAIEEFGEIDTFTALRRQIAQEIIDRPRPK